MTTAMSIRIADLAARMAKCEDAAYLNVHGYSASEIKEATARAAQVREMNARATTSKSALAEQVDEAPAPPQPVTEASLLDTANAAVWPDGEGRKDDGGKDPWRLFPWDAARAIVKVLSFGAVKYSERNWEKGMDWSRPFDACIRHLTSWWEGEKADPDTGYSHLWHAGCCVLFLISYELRGIGRDNRPGADNSD